MQPAATARIAKSFIVMREQSKDGARALLARRRLPALTGTCPYVRGWFVPARAYLFAFFAGGLLPCLASATARAADMAQRQMGQAAGRWPRAGQKARPK